MIQVWYQGKNVGVLHRSVLAGRKALTFTEVDARDGRISERAFSLNARRTLIPYEVENRTSLRSHLKHELGLDESHVTVTRDELSAQYEIIWLVLVAADIDEYEYLFDQPDFDPL